MTPDDRSPGRMRTGELTRRWAVAAVGVPVVIGVLYVGLWLLGLAVVFFGVVGSSECYRLARQKGVKPVRWLGVPAAAGLVAAAVVFPSGREFSAVALPLLGVVTLAALMIATFARSVDENPLVTAAVTLLGAVYPALALAVVPLVHAMPERLGWSGPNGTPWAGVVVVALPLAATWIGDATAFFAGSAFGRRRLAPSISPKKSWEGAIAGVLASGATALVWSRVASGALPDAPVHGAWLLLGVGAMLGVGAIAGDLIESSLKRDAGVKDSGTLLPGHGGVLDRIDALVVTLPLSYALLLLLEAFR